MKKLVLISGSGRGLGSSIARSFISSGYRVAINYMKSEEQAHNLSNELGENALAFKADISDKSQVISMLNDIEDYGEMNEAYVKFFNKRKSMPSRSTFGAKIALNGKIEIECWAVK